VKNIGSDVFGVNGDVCDRPGHREASFGGQIQVTVTRDTLRAGDGTCS
jgi:hypothetical protein